MPKLNSTKTLAAAAATAASTVLAVTTVAIETATAAIFTHTSSEGVLRIEYNGTQAQFESSSDEDWTNVSWTNSSVDEEINFELTEDPTGVFSSSRRYWFFSEGTDEVLRIYLSGEVVLEEWNISDIFPLTTGRNEFRRTDFVVEGASAASVPEPSGAIALGVLGLGAVASRLRRRSK